jgi:DNA-binding Lrp family transcriptional regulator
MSKLEKDGVIRRRIMALPDFEKIGFVAVIIGLDVKPSDTEKTISFLKTVHQAKFLWRTYGTHDLIVVIICDKGDVGKCIHNLKKALEEKNITPTKFDVSVSIIWEKMQVVP